MTHTAHQEAAVTQAVDTLSGLFRSFAPPVKKPAPVTAKILPFGRPEKKTEAEQPPSQSLRTAYAVANARDVMFMALNCFGQKDEASTLKTTMDKLSDALKNNDVMEIYEGLDKMMEQTQALLDASHYLQSAIGDYEAAGKVHKLYTDVAIMGGQSPWPREDGKQGITPSPIKF